MIDVPPPSDGKFEAVMTQPTIVVCCAVKAAPLFESYTEHCPYCQVPVVTKVRYEWGNSTWCILVLSLFVWPLLDRSGWPQAGSAWPSSSASGAAARYHHSQQHHHQQQQQPHSAREYRAPAAYPSLGYMDSSMTPAPAPAPRSGSVGPSHYGYPSTSTRRTLTRQHRSMDTVGPLDGLEIAFTDNLQEPLNVNTQPLGSSYPSTNYRAPLSNPIPSQQAFWSRTANDPMMPYSDTGGPSGLGRPNYGSAEYDQVKQDYLLAMEKLNQTMNSIKTFWSPELKRERQLRREEATRLAQLERIVSSGVSGGDSAVQLHREISARDEKIRHLSAMLDDPLLRSGGGGGIGSSFSETRIRELEETIMRLQDILKQKDQETLGQLDPTGRYALDNALRRIDEKQHRISELEEEMHRMRIHGSSQPRDFTDKSISSHDMLTIRMKMERSEVELAERKTELAQCQTRMRTAEEQSTDLRTHLQIAKDQLTTREQQCALLQGDVEALRQKLEAKNDLMQQKEQRIERLEKELAGSRGDVQEKNEQSRMGEIKIQQLQGRIDHLETTLREKESDLDKAKIRLLSHPDVIKEKELCERIEQIEREKHRLEDHIDQLRRNSEKERVEQQETFHQELRQQRLTIDNLQKELQDRDVLLESQNEKIGDLSRENATVQQRIQKSMADKGTEELRREVESARMEVDKLLKMVRQLEKDNQQLNQQTKQLQGVIDRHGADPHSTLSKSDTSSLSRLANQQTPAAANAMKKRIEELEEALRESVSITAEREVHLSQQKHLLQQVNQQLVDCRREIAELRKSNAPGGIGADREQLLRTMEAERRQHLEQLLQLKQEALLAAIGEKDAHLALLEKGRAPREEIETIRRHKEALMRKLKQENERRALVVRPESAASIVQAGAAIGPGAILPPLVQPSPRQQDVMVTSGELDDDGIWA